MARYVLVHLHASGFLRGPVLVVARKLGLSLAREPRFLLLVHVLGVVSVGGLFPFLFVCGFPCERFAGL